MGATFWSHLTPYDPDPEVALRRCQVAFFQESGYDLLKYLKERIAAMEQAVRWCEEDDQYNLLDFYRDALRQYQEMVARKIPEEPKAQIALLRQIEEISGDWLQNILDLTGISQSSEVGKAQRLSPDELQAYFGTIAPSLAQVHAGMDRLTETIRRGEAVCSSVYEGNQPVSWFFAGYSAD
jgi:hypothetical protein